MFTISFLIINLQSFLIINVQSNVFLKYLGLDVAIIIILEFDTK